MRCTLIAARRPVQRTPSCVPERRVMPSRAALVEALEEETKRAEEKAAKGAAAKPKASAAVRSHQKKCALRECA